MSSEKEHDISYSTLLGTGRIRTGPGPHLPLDLVPVNREPWQLGSLLAFIDCDYRDNLCFYTLVLMLPTSLDEA